MSRLRYNWQVARSHLREACPRLRAFIEAFGQERLRLRSEPDLFSALSRAIVYQQLSGKAAATIHGRFAGLFPLGRPNAADAVRLTFEQLRGAGLSRSKALSIQDLAERSLAGELPSPRVISGLTDEEVIERLCAVRGIGPWTVQMHLIFNLGRPDVMPATDLGVQKGVQRIYGLGMLPSPVEVFDLTSHLAPYRSAASWYFWRATEAA